MVRHDGHSDALRAVPVAAATALASAAVTVAATTLAITPVSATAALASLAAATPVTPSPPSPFAATITGAFPSDGNWCVGGATEKQAPSGWAKIADGSWGRPDEPPDARELDKLEARLRAVRLRGVEFDLM